MPAGSSLCAMCMCMCVAGRGCDPDVPPLLAQSATPSPRTASLRLPLRGQSVGTVHRKPAPPQPEPGPRSAPGPGARFFVAGPPRSIAPSPLRPLAKVTRERAGEGRPRGPAARRPSHPSRPAALPARLLLARVRAPNPPLFSILCFFHFYSLFRGKLVSISLLDPRFPPCLIPPPLCPAPSLPLSASSSYSH